jgi:outer membrane protein
MQNNTIFLYITVFLTLFRLESSAYAMSDSLWTLEKCIQKAQEENFKIKKQEQDVENGNINARQAKANLTPTVYGTANNNWNFGRSIDPFTNQFTNSTILAQNYGVTSSWILFQGFQNQRSIQYNNAEVRALNEDMNALKENVALEVTGYFMDILYFKEEVKIRKNTISTTEAITNRTEKLVQAGTRRESDLASLRAQLADEQRMLVEAENNYLLRKTDLALFLNINDVENFDIAVPDAIPLDQDWERENIQSLYEKSVNERPLIKALKHRSSSLNHYYAVQQGKYYPRLTFNMGVNSLYSSSSKTVNGYTNLGNKQIGFLADNTPVYQTNVQGNLIEKPFHLQVSDNFSQYVGFSLYVPILNNYQTKAANAKAKVSLKKLEYETSIAEQQVKKDVTLAYTKCANAHKKLKAAEAALDLQKENLRYAEKNLEAGINNSVEYTQAKWRYENSQSEWLRAQYEALFRTKILDFYRGIPITL